MWYTALRINSGKHTIPIEYMVAMEKIVKKLYSNNVYFISTNTCPLYCVPENGSSHGRLNMQETSIHWGNKSVETTACFPVHNLLERRVL
jgi:hypothetical protein